MFTGPETIDGTAIDAILKVHHKHSDTSESGTLTIWKLSAESLNWETWLVDGVRNCYPSHCYGSTETRWNTLKPNTSTFSSCLHGTTAAGNPLNEWMRSAFSNSGNHPLKRPPTPRSYFTLHFSPALKCSTHSTAGRKLEMDSQ